MSKSFTLILTLLCACMYASAQNDNVTPTSLDSVIITANKFVQKQRSTGKIVSVITKETIDRNAAKSLGQLLSEQAGITINGNNNSPGTRQSLFMRGAAEGRTLILLDGIPIYDPSMINNDVDLNLISLQNIERIEVCRGAQSTIYGSDAVAGVINIITFNPRQTKPLNIGLTASAGSYGLFKGALGISGKKGKLSYSIKYSQLHSSGFSAATDSSGNSNFDRDAFGARMLTAHFQYQLNPVLAWKGFFHASNSRTDLDAAAFTDERDYDVNSRTKNAGTGISYVKNKLQLHLNYNYTHNNRFYLNDSIHDEGSVMYSALQYLSAAHFVEAYSTIQLGGGFSLLQGADFRASHMSSSNYSLSAYGPYSSTFNDTGHHQSSIYASVFYQSPKKGLHVDLGGRWNIHSQYGSNETFTFNPSYSINEQFRIMGSIASSFKAPTLFQLYSAYGERDLQPEQSVTYEVGVEQQHGFITNRLDVFYRKTRSGIDFNYITYKYFNITDQVVKGIELESSIHPTKSFTVNLNYTYLHSQETSQSRTTFKDTVYHYLLRRPAHTLNVNGSYTVTKKIFVSAGVKYVSRRFDIGGYQQQDLPLDDYVLLNLYGDYRFNPSVKIFADLQNVTHTKFIDIIGYNSVPFLFNGGISITL